MSDPVGFVAAVIGIASMLGGGIVAFERWHRRRALREDKLDRISAAFDRPDVPGQVDNSVFGVLERIEDTSTEALTKVDAFGHELREHLIAETAQAAEQHTLNLEVARRLGAIERSIHTSKRHAAGEGA